MATECGCGDCVDACKHRPGWFLPGEVDKAAGFLGLSPEEFFKRYLGVDYWVDDGEVRQTDIFAPRHVGRPGGQRYPFYPAGRCVFLDENERCKIHLVKPAECAHYIHTMDEKEPYEFRKEVARAWSSEEGRSEVHRITEGRFGSPASTN